MLLPVLNKPPVALLRVRNEKGRAVQFNASVFFALGDFRMYARNFIIRFLIYLLFNIFFIFFPGVYSSNFFLLFSSTKVGELVCKNK